MDDIAVMADRIIALKDGKVVMDGTPKEVFSDRKRVEEIGLDVPFATSLSDEFIARGYDLPKDIISLDELADALSKIRKNEGVKADV